MKKRLIAAALLAGFVGTAQAQSTVTLYGTLDGGLHYTRDHLKIDDKVTNKTGFGITEGVQSGNKFGLKGTEELGNGLNVMFKLEGKFSIVDGSSSALFGKKAYFGITGDSGTLTAGLQGNAVDELAPDDGGWNNFDFVGDIGGSKLSPGLKYVSPDLQGFQFAASWGGDNNTTKGDDTTTKTHHNRFALGLAYNLGALNVNAGVAKANYSSKQTSFIVGANYDFGPVAVFARYGHANVVDLSGLDLLDEVKDLDAGGLPANVFAFAVSVPVSETGTLFANYQHAWGSKKVTTLVDDQAATTKVKVKGDLFNLAYVEKLSKLTSVYVYGGYNAQSGKFPTTVKKNNTEVAVGLTHSF